MRWLLNAPVYPNFIISPIMLHAPPIAPKPLIYPLTSVVHPKGVHMHPFGKHCVRRTRHHVIRMVMELPEVYVTKWCVTMIGFNDRISRRETAKVVDLWLSFYWFSFEVKLWSILSSVLYMKLFLQADKVEEMVARHMPRGYCSSIDVFSEWVHQDKQTFSPHGTLLHSYTRCVHGLYNQLTVSCSQ